MGHIADLRTQVASLISETEDQADAEQYAYEIAEDLGISIDEVLAEIRRQCHDTGTSS